MDIVTNNTCTGTVQGDVTYVYGTQLSGQQLGERRWEAAGTRRHCTEVCSLQQTSIIIILNHHLLHPQS